MLKPLKNAKVEEQQKQFIFMFVMFFELYVKCGGFFAVNELNWLFETLKSTFATMQNNSKGNFVKMLKLKL